MTSARQPMIPTGRELWQAADCTDRQIEVLELKHQNGLSLYETADALDLSVSTVRTHLKAGQRRIELYLRQRKQAA